MIETHRLRLRPHQVTDFNRYLPLWLKPEPPNSGPQPHLTAEDVWARLLRFVGHWSHFGYGLFVVEDSATGEIVGEMGCAHFNRGIAEHFDAAPEAAWRVLVGRRGEGIAREGMHAALAWFDRMHDATRTVCLIHRSNTASISVAEHLGYGAYSECEFKGHAAVLFERSRQTGDV